ncbi:TonB-dependent siderophore receptor [Steroidobacter sp.]|uniref:TonB-dependent siderophore receptor n=1 Tax=Steroidobacter sp. TaxID=1978227 RepID=UPI001A5CEADB|nr:TonB-dependent siderophore receptor [Steroidobacter sp.]MBL8266494.1 TonB-dependent siderophore receptor [Steroidobacter sp.]
MTEASSTELDYVLVEGTRLRDEVTLGRTGTTLRETPQSVTIMGQARIEAQNLRNLDEVLIQTPGIILLADSTVENTYTTRGHVIESIQYDNITTGTNPETIASPNMAMFEGVEVLRGSNGILNGVNGFGSINLRRKRPLDNFQGSTSITGGTWDRYHGELDVTGPVSERIRARGVVSYDDRGFFFPYAGFKEKLVFGTMEFDLTETTLLRIASHWQKTDVTPNSPGVAFYSDGGDLGLPRDTMLSPGWADFDYDTKNYMIELQQSLGSWNSRLIMSRFDTKSSNFYAYFWGGMDRATGMPSEEWGGLYGEQLDLTYEQNAADLSFWGPVNLFGREHEVLVGAVRSQEHYAWYYGDLTPQIFEQISVDQMRSWDAGSAVKPHRVPADYYGPDRFIAQTGIFARISLNIADPLTLVLGARVNYWRHREQSIEAATNTVYEDLDLKMDGDVSPQAAITWKVTEDWSLYASYADMLVPQSAQDANGNVLKPRVAANYEAGIKGELFDGRFNASLAFFRVDEKNRALGVDGPPNQNNVAPSIAAGQTVSDGFEIETTGQLTPDWTLDAGYTYNTNEYKRDNENQGRAFSTYTPKHMYKLWTNYRLPAMEGRWSFGGGINGQSSLSQPIYADDWSALINKDGYTIVSLRVGFRINDRWSASLNVNNITDETYYAGSIGNSISGNHFYGDPRNFVFAIRGKLWGG